MIDAEILKEISTTLKVLRNKDEVAEIRILNTTQRTVSGYFNNPDAAAKAVSPYIGKNDIYFTLNPVNSDLLARAKNRLQPYAKQTTSDNDIEKLDYVLIDLDPVRPAGISASDQEHQLAKQMSNQIVKFLKEKGFPSPIVANSGNGYHIILPTDLENTAENVQLLKDFLNTLDFLFSNEKVEVDRTTYNPSRIVKLYGTKACKGDDTQERAHRWSGITDMPDELVMVTAEQLKDVITLMPVIEKTKKSAAKSPIDDMGKWLAEKGLTVAYEAPFHNKGTKYILERCPFNHDHTNKSAYVIKFNDGGIAAGCLHNSCRDHNWTSLRDKLEPGWNKKKRGSNDEKNKKQAVVIKELADRFNAKYMTNELDEPYVAIEVRDHVEIMPTRSKKLALYLSKLYYDDTGSVPDNDALKQAIGLMEAQAIFSDSQQHLYRRIAENNGHIYYDLADKNWQAIKITKNGLIIGKNPILFTRSKNMREQVLPDINAKPSELVDLVRKYFRLKKLQDLILFVVYLVSCFLPQIAHVILILYGEKGAAKSTFMRMVKRLVDPALQDLLTMPSSLEDMAITLANNYMACFDNLDTLSAAKSDMLCMAATGGAFVKRKLYTDSDETILQFKRCVGLNGINIVATRPDLLDRAIVLELERIPKDCRKTEKAIWDAFEQDLPRFMGAIFNTISGALAVYPSVDIDEVGRMADFTYWGYAIAEVLGIGGEDFLQAYLANQDNANEEAIASHPVSAAIMILMQKKRIWSDSVSSLLRELEVAAESGKINTSVKVWPRDPHVLSKRLKEIKSNLEEVGIFYDIRHAGNYKRITLENRNSQQLESKEKHGSPKTKQEIRQSAVERQAKEGATELKNFLTLEDEPSSTDLNL